MKLKRSHDSFWLLGLFILALILWLINLGDLPLRDWDEGYYGTVAKDMYHSSNWIFPSYLGDDFLLKPPLAMWLITLSYHWGGINEWTTRFPLAFISALSVPLLYLLGKQAFQSRSSALFTALIYLTLLPVVRHTRLAMLDGIINTFWIFSLWCLLQSRQRKIWAVGFGLGLGGIAMTKGILVLALGGLVVIFLLVSQQFNLLKNPFLWVGLLLGTMFTLNWYGAQFAEYGSIFIDVHFRSQSIDRLSTAVEGNSGPFWYYLLELSKYCWPWLMFFPGALLISWKKRKEVWEQLTLICGLGFLVLISLMGTKLPWYIMPFYPFFAMGIGGYLGSLWRSQTACPRWIGRLLMIQGVIAFGGGIYFIWQSSPRILIATSLILTLTFFIAAWQFLQDQKIALVSLVIGLYCALISFMLSPAWIWELNEAFAVKPVAELIQGHIPKDEIVFTAFPYSRPSLDFYSERKVIAADMITWQKLSPEATYWLLDPPSLNAIGATKYMDLGDAGDFTLIKTQPND